MMNRRVTVVGLGREGLAVTRLLAREGALVTVSDARGPAQLATQMEALASYPIRYSLGGHRSDEVFPCDLLVLSPGVDKRLPLVQEALRRGVTLSSETELFTQRCTAPIAGITGSSGKTTTTTLVGAMLRAEGRWPVYVGGNIGRPLLEEVASIPLDARVVLELSSFQLEWLRSSPSIAAITNITPNHLDRHETMEAYIEAKSHIISYQDRYGVAVLNHDDALVSALSRNVQGRLLQFSLNRPASLAFDEGAYLDGQRLVMLWEGRQEVLCERADIQVPGLHTVANMLTAACVARAAGAELPALREAISAFRGVPHRLQRIAVMAGVSYYNDSIATSPERTLAALAALDAPVVLLLGGRDKHLPWERLVQVAWQRCRGIVLLGEAAPLIRHALEEGYAALGGAESFLQPAAIVDVTDMAEAVCYAQSLATPGDAVVLAPGCASYDMYQDFEQRGEDFAQVVRRLGDHGEA